MSTPRAMSWPVPTVYLIIMHICKHVVAKVRISGVIKVETGRYARLSVNEGICNTCNYNETEGELHFLFKCPYHDLRQNFINKACETKTNFLSSNDSEKLRHVVENHFILLQNLL